MLPEHPVRSLPGAGTVPLTSLIRIARKSTDAPAGGTAPEGSQLWRSITAIVEGCPWETGSAAGHPSVVSRLVGITTEAPSGLVPMRIGQPPSAHWPGAFLLMLMSHSFSCWGGLGACFMLALSSPARHVTRFVDPLLGAIAIEDSNCDWLPFGPGAEPVADLRESDEQPAVPTAAMTADNVSTTRYRANASTSIVLCRTCRPL